MTTPFRLLHIYQNLSSCYFFFPTDVHYDTDIPFDFDKTSWDMMSKHSLAAFIIHFYPTV